jgi:hypothetical protein
MEIGFYIYAFKHSIIQALLIKRLKNFFVINKYNTHGSNPDFRLAGEL